MNAKWFFILTGMVLGDDVAAQSNLHPVVCPTSLNVFYAGIRNPVEIAVPGIPSENLVVHISDGHDIQCDEPGTCVVVPQLGLPVAEIVVEVKRADGTVESLPPRTFRVKRIPDPTTSWTGKTSVDMWITKSELLCFPPVVARMENFDFEVRARVTSFTLGVELGGEFRYFRAYDSNRLTEEMQQALHSVKIGDRIWLGDVTVSMPGDELRRIGGPITLTVSE